MADKGKGIANDDDGYSSGKRKRNADDNKSGTRKRKNPNVLQFFEDSAFEAQDSASSDDDDDFNDDISMFFDDDFVIPPGPGPEVKPEPKTSNIPFFPKEEEMDEAEMEKMMEERYRPGANFVTYAEDQPQQQQQPGPTTRARMDEGTASATIHWDPIIWRVKCVVGRERHSAFCLMQKYLDLKSIGTKLQIVSAFAVEHVKGSIYIEAEKQNDIQEACKGLCNIYPTRVAPVPVSEVPHLFTVRAKYSGVSVNTWARVKAGTYKGDLAQVVSVDDAKKKVTIKLVPRIDLHAVAEKFGGGVKGKKGKKAAIPAPRLITSSELEAYRPLVQYRHDRNTRHTYEVFDGLTLKDGYLFKKCPFDSLSFWDIRPSEAELIKFSPAHKEESNDAEWLTGLFGERKKRQPSISNNKGGKGEGSSSSSMEDGFEVHDLVFHGRKGFGIVVGREKDDRIKVLEEGSDKPMVVAVEARMLKKADFIKNFTAFDQHKKIISVNDTVRILEGPLEDKRGIVKQIYKGVIFLHDENESENCGYFCAKAQICEKMDFSADFPKGKGGKSDTSGFDDFPKSPKSPLSPNKPFEAPEKSHNFDQEDKDGFSVGQSLRIRVGPLKGYMCRVMAIRYSDITVKLDSQHKILTVKAENLAEVKSKNSGVSSGDGQDSTKPFELLGDHGSAQGWMDGAGASEPGGWNTGGQSTERSSWAPFPASGSSLEPVNSMEDAGGSGWGTKTTQVESTPWGASASENKTGGWGASSSAADKNDNSDDSGWGSAKLKSVDNSNDAPSWGNAGGSSAGENKSAWGSAAAPAAETGGWGSTAKKDEDSTGWGMKNSATTDGGSSWGKASDEGNKTDAGGSGWGKKDTATTDGGSSWGKASDDGNKTDAGGSGWGKKDTATTDGGSSWGKASDDGNKTDAGGSGWGKKDTATTDGGSSWGKASDDGNKTDAGGSGWGKKDTATTDGGSSWGKVSDDGNKTDDGGSGWGNKPSATGGWGNTEKEAGGSGWSKSGGGGGSSWGGQDGGFGSNKQDGSRGGGSGNCFKCGESGHMSRECPQGGGGGNRNCYKCGESGHMSRECPKGGSGGGDRNCFKCGESGHMSRECPKGGGGGDRSCYKCGESGHMSRECPQGGGGGGGNAPRVAAVVVVIMKEAPHGVVNRKVDLLGVNKKVDPLGAVNRKVDHHGVVSLRVVDLVGANKMEGVVVVAGMPVLNVVRVGICLGNALKGAVAVVVAEIATSVVRADTCLGNALREEEAAAVVVGAVTSVVKVGTCLENARRVVAAEAVETEIASSVGRVVICLVNAPRVVAVVEVAEVATSAVRVGICLGNALRVAAVEVEVAEIASNAVRVGTCLGNALRVAAAVEGMVVAAAVEGMVVVVVVVAAVVVVGAHQGGGEVTRHLMMQAKKTMDNQEVGAVAIKQPGEDGVVVIQQQRKRMMHKQLAVVKLRAGVHQTPLMDKEVAGAVVVAIRQVRRKAGAMIVVKQEEVGDLPMTPIRRMTRKVVVAGRNQAGSYRSVL